MADALIRDPYKDYRFLILFEGKSVAGVNKVTGLTKQTTKIGYRFSNDDPTSFSTPGLTDYDPVTLTGGITRHSAFHDWGRSLDPHRGYERTSNRVRKDITIQLMNDIGNAMIIYQLVNCWVAEYSALPQLDSMGNSIAIQTLTLNHEGFTRA